jgi:hypothetical protein
MDDTSPADGNSPSYCPREMHEFLAQETRYHIIQTILGHPDQLASLTELAYYSRRSESAIVDQLRVVEDNGLVTAYVLEESKGFECWVHSAIYAGFPRSGPSTTTRGNPNRSGGTRKLPAQMCRNQLQMCSTSMRKRPRKIE